MRTEQEIQTEIERLYERIEVLKLVFKGNEKFSKSVGHSISNDLIEINKLMWVLNGSMHRDATNPHKV